jgi:hypothetical protein
MKKRIMRSLAKNLEFDSGLALRRVGFANGLALYEREKHYAPHI